MGIWIRNGETKRGTGTWNDFHGIFTDLSMSLGAPHGPMATTHEIPISFFAAYGDFKMARNITR